MSTPTNVLHMPLTPIDREAIGLYVVLARDPLDFLEMVRAAKPEVREVLRKMLTTPNPEQSRKNAELNALGARLMGWSS